MEEKRRKEKKDLCLGKEMIGLFRGRGLNLITITVFSLPHRASEAHCSAPAAGRRPDVPANPAER